MFAVSNIAAVQQGKATVCGNCAATVCWELLPFSVNCAAVGYIVPFLPMAPFPRFAPAAATHRKTDTPYAPQISNACAKHTEQSSSSPRAAWAAVLCRAAGYTPEYPVPLLAPALRVAVTSRYMHSNRCFRFRWLVIAEAVQQQLCGAWLYAALGCGLQ